ncbi:MAG: hypothetical protein M3186_06555 [Actinomycetota bacterium]|nr:hypothetical protein [Actinomycetota bacterium]
MGRGVLRLACSFAAAIVPRRPFSKFESTGRRMAAMPRVGRTFAMRVLALAVALDPLVELRVFELKCTGLQTFEGCAWSVAHVYPQR